MDVLHDLLPYVELGFAGLCILGVPRLRTKPIPNPSAALCGCGHDLAVHDPETSKCHAQIERPHYRKDGYHNGNEYVACPCRVYTGPRPIDQVFPPRLQLPPS